ncbi:hypothetical protein ACO03_11535 [Pantoea ananatis]|nr:hypothetical protein ACO03_11535 [Pantoea ananatis]
MHQKLLVRLGSLCGYGSVFLCVCLGGCMSDEKMKSFEEAAKPLIKWLAENEHPHHTAIITSVHAELLESKISFPTMEFIKD